MVHAYIVTGFLGAGKTTVLTHIIKEHFFNKKVAIIVNEFGKVGIDGEVLRNVHTQVLEIQQGCICCQLLDDFNKGITEIVKRYNPEVIFIETSGVSEPVPIFASLKMHKISVDGVICVVDAQNFDSYKQETSAKKQIGGANIIVLNKCEQIQKEQIKAVEKELIEIKNRYDVKIGQTQHKLFRSYYLECAKDAKVDKKIFEISDMLDPKAIEQNGELQIPHSHGVKDAIEKKICYIKDGTTFEQIETLFGMLPKDLYRAKGVVKLKDFEKPQLINYAFGSYTHEDLKSYNKESVIVFIGRSISQKIDFLAKVTECLIVPSFSVK